MNALNTGFKSVRPRRLVILIMDGSAGSERREGNTVAAVPPPLAATCFQLLGLALPEHFDPPLLLFDQ